MDMTVDYDQYDVITPDFYFADDGEDSETGEVTAGPISYDWEAESHEGDFSARNPVNSHQKMPECFT